MPIPDFQNNGLLPPGGHVCTWTEINQKMGFTEQRKRLLEGLKKMVEMLPEKHVVRRIIVDGSFAEDKANPADIDLVLDVGVLADGTPEQTVVDWVSDRARVLKAELGCDAYADDHDFVEDYWMGRQFSHTRDGQEKGFLILEALPQ